MMCGVSIYQICLIKGIDIIITTLMMACPGFIKDFLLLTHWEPPEEDKKANNLNKFDTRNFYTYLESTM